MTRTFFQRRDLLVVEVEVEFDGLLTRFGGRSEHFLRLANELVAVLDLLQILVEQVDVLHELEIGGVLALEVVDHAVHHFQALVALRCARRHSLRHS